MAQLPLNSLQVSGFRGFRDLKVKQLGRVNLIVGRNNIGKSSLLEALRLYSQRGSPTLVSNLLGARDELRSTSRKEVLREGFEVEEQTFSIRYLFYGRPDLHILPKPISIGPLNNETETIVIELIYPSMLEDVRQQSLFVTEQGVAGYPEETGLFIRVTVGSRASHVYAVDGLQRRSSLGLNSTGISDIVNTYVPANGLSKAAISSLWDKTALTNREDDVLGALRIIAPDLQRLTIIGDEYGRERVPIVKVSDIESPVPLRNMGEGMNRMFGVALALVNTRQGILLIDEIESGLHYSVQADLWRLLFEVARTLEIQIFATTHSWDCIEAFQRVAVADPLSVGMLVKLEMQGPDVESTLFDERELTIATRNDIELR